MLPSRGACHAIFLLAYSVRLRPARDLSAWIASARGRDTLMAAALNLERVARTLVALNLASVSDRGVTISRSLLAVSRLANDESFAHIAQLVLERAPPPWLRVAIGDDGVRREYIPQAELDAMAWLGNRLDPLLLQVYGTVTAERDDTFRKRLGDAAEHIVLAALERLGGEVLHVAALSDGFGYDIEHRTLAGVARLEVKAATAQTADGFFLSRNEFEKSRLFGTEWRLVQVIFKPSALLGTEIGTTHVEAIREISAAKINELVPADTPEFVWQESARIRPPSLAWKLSSITPDSASAASIEPSPALSAHFLAPRDRGGSSQVP